MGEKLMGASRRVSVVGSRGRCANSREERRRDVSVWGRCAKSAALGGEEGWRRNSVRAGGSWA